MSEADGSRRPLLRIADFSTHLSGPMASSLLGQLGADVLKIENTGDGDGNRTLAPFIHDLGMFHLALNAGTRSLSISKRSPHWQAVVRACVEWADAVVVGGRPDDAARLGLGYEDLIAADDQLVYCLITGYGERGAWRDFPAHGQQPDAMAGLVPVQWTADGLPETPPGWRTAGTTLAGTFAALGILAALREQEADGAPKYISVSLWGSALWWNWRDINTYANTGEGWPDYQTLGSRYAMYPTADDRVIILCPGERKFWHELCDLLELPAELRERGRWDISRMDFGRGPEYDAERLLIAERMRTRTLEEWIPILGATEIPFAPVLTWAEALDQEHTRDNHVMTTMTTDEHEVDVIGVPVRIGAGPDGGVPVARAPLGSAPTLGRDTAAVLDELGLDAAAADVRDGRLS